MSRFIADQIRTKDYSAFLTSIFIPTPSRPSVWAIHSFNIETASIRDGVSNTQIAKMKIQWWRDTLQKVYKDSPPNQPTALALHEALKSRPLSQSWFKRILQARESNIDRSEFSTLEELESYAENTASSVLYLQLEALGITNVKADLVASHIGKAMGITTLLRASPFLIPSRQWHLPLDLLSKHGVSIEKVYRHGTSQELQDCVFQVATRANDHLITARSHFSKCPQEALPALLGAIPCQEYLNRLERANFNLFDPQLLKKSWRTPFTLWKHMRNQSL